MVKKLCFFFREVFLLCQILNQRFIRFLFVFICLLLGFNLDFMQIDFILVDIEKQYKVFCYRREVNLVFLFCVNLSLVQYDIGLLMRLRGNNFKEVRMVRGKFVLIIFEVINVVFFNYFFLVIRGFLLNQFEQYFICQIYCQIVVIEYKLNKYNFFDIGLYVFCGGRKKNQEIVFYDCCFKGGK